MSVAFAPLSVYFSFSFTVIFASPFSVTTGFSVSAGFVCLSQFSVGAIYWASAALFQEVSVSLFGLVMMSSLLRMFFEAAVILIAIIFQPEIRKALEQMGRNNTYKKYLKFFTKHGKSDEWKKAVRKSIIDAADTAVLFSRSHTGALLVFERETMLSDIAATGTIVDAETSVALFGNIFFNKAPLHDGASIIRDGKLFSAGCILPLTDNKNVDINLGTRHRAALGISEQSDAVVLVVSEETGVISLAINGILLRDFTRDSLVTNSP